MFDRDPDLYQMNTDPKPCFPSLHLEITGEYFSVWKAAHLEGPVRAAGVEERAGQIHLRHTLAHVLEQTVPETRSKLYNVSNQYGI